MWYINWPEGSKVRLVCGHTGQVTGAATTSDGLQLATCCGDGTVAVWSMESLEQTVVFQTPKKVISTMMRNFKGSTCTYMYIVCILLWSP